MLPFLIQRLRKSTGFKMEEWDDWNYLFRNYITAKISGPVSNVHEFEDIDHQIEICNEICRPDIRYNECVERMQELLLVSFNFTHNKTFSYGQYIGN